MTRFTDVLLASPKIVTRKFNKELFNQVPLQYLASMLGITPETLSRIRRKVFNRNLEADMQEWLDLLKQACED